MAIWVTLAMLVLPRASPDVIRQADWVGGQCSGSIPAPVLSWFVVGDQPRCWAQAAARRAPALDLRVGYQELRFDFPR